MHRRALPPAAARSYTHPRLPSRTSPSRSATMTLRRPVSAAIAVLAITSLASRAQDKPPPAEEIQALQKKYQEERATALEKKFPANALERADEQAKRAEEALKAGNNVAAARFIR